MPLYSRADHAPEAFPPVHERALLYYALAALLLGAQMMSIGFLAELITAYQSRDEDRYSIAEQVASEREPPRTAPRNDRRLPEDDLSSVG